MIKRPKSKTIFNQNCGVNLPGHRNEHRNLVLRKFMNSSRTDRNENYEATRYQPPDLCIYIYASLVPKRVLHSLFTILYSRVMYTVI